LNDTADTAADAAQTAAFIFEFDHLVATLREASFEVLQSIFDDVDLQPVHYSRFGLTMSPHKTIEMLQNGLGVKKGQPKKVSEELVSGIKMHLESGNVQVSDALRNIIVQARERNMKVVGMTALPPQARDALADRLDLSGLGIELYSFSKELDPFPRADAWLRLTKESGLVAASCISLTTSAQSCKSSITADIPTISYPDLFTSFQDFGGSLDVIESLKDLKLATYLDYEIASA
jgi:beta-phosphoglucomutase-like phosphatase (HAD superfamily)